MSDLSGFRHDNPFCMLIGLYLLLHVCISSCPHTRTDTYISTISPTHHRVVIPELVAFEVMALQHHDGSVQLGHVETQVIRPDLLIGRVREHLDVTQTEHRPQITSAFLSLYICCQENSFSYYQKMVGLERILKVKIKRLAFQFGSFFTTTSQTLFRPHQRTRPGDT